MIEIGDLFHCYYDHFSVIRANTTTLLDEVYRLRYQVYCVENCFENADAYPDGRETDEHDEASVHILLRHKKTGTPVGTARVIMPHRGEKLRPLPIHRVIASEVRQEFERLPLGGTAEISRFAVSKQFRRWWRERRHSTERDRGPIELQLMYYIAFGLFSDILQIAIEQGITCLAATMESSLIRILVKLGLQFEPIGAPVEFHGIRQPCVASLADLLKQSRERFTPLWQFVNFRSAFALQQSTPWRDITN